MDCQGKTTCERPQTNGNTTFLNILGTCDNNGEQPAIKSLQDAFLKFKKNKQNKLRQVALMKDEMKKTQRDENQLEKLRLKFVEQAKMYLGVPYARRYHEPGSPEYDAPLFLDCCGLIRKVLRDLKEEFAFDIGPWNQAYMFDTLPDNIQSVSEMKPGDLVFVSGVFFNPKMRMQRHNIVHVEIWAGDGERTIGARYQRGKLQIHDSYQYVSKSYHSMVYHFKSIDTWLNGICKSFCNEHLWNLSSYVPGKRSIFSLQEPGYSDQPAEDESEENVLNTEGHLEMDEVDKADFSERNGLKILGNELDSRNNQTEELILYEQMKSEIGGNICGRNDDDEIIDDPATIENLQNHTWDWENGCFCGHCSYEENDKLISENGDQLEQGLEVKNFGTALNCSRSCDNDYSRHHGIEGGDLRCLATSGSMENDIAVSRDEANIVSQDVLTCPNNGGNKGETRKQKMTVSTTVSRRGKGGSSRKKSYNDDDDESDDKRPTQPLFRHDPSYTRPHKKSPTFFIGGHNGVKMIDATLTSLGWKRILDNNDRSFNLKWVECKKNLDFSSFREGEQLVNHIPNGNLLTTKIGLLTSLQEFERVNNKMQSSTASKVIEMKDFFPETYKLQSQGERDNFIQHVYRDGETWICKPTGMNQGKGIFLIRNRNELQEKLGAKIRQKCSPSPGRVIQRYIPNPLLLNGFKADIRTYMLIAGTCPYMVFYHPGYVRLSVVPYSLNQQEIHAHLTNQYVQKKHPLYEQVKEETVWSLEKLQEYINNTYNTRNTLPEDWVMAGFTKRMQEIMLQCFNSVRYKLDRKLGYFDLLGFDFMLDENFKVWLIEINVNPALHTNCKILADIIPELVDGSLKLVLEVFEKSKKRERLTPVENLGKFQLLYNGEKK